MNAEVAALPDRGGFVSVLGTRCQHLRNANERDVIDGLNGAHRCDRYGGRTRRIDDAALWRDHAHWAHYTFVPGDVVAKQGIKRRQQATPAAPLGTIHGARRLGARSGEVEHERVRLLGQRKSDFMGVALHVHELPRGPEAIRQFQQPRAQQLLGFRDERRADFSDGRRTVLCKQRLETFARHMIAGNHRTNIQGNQLGRPHHVQKGVKDILANLVAVDQPDSRRRKPFREYISCVRTKPARIHRTDIADMDEAGRPRDQYAFKMNRRHDVNVGSMQRRRVRVVQQIHIAFIDPVLEAADDGLAGF